MERAAIRTAQQEDQRRKKLDREQTRSEEDERQEHEERVVDGVEIHRNRKRKQNIAGEDDSDHA